MHIRSNKYLLAISAILIASTFSVYAVNISDTDLLILIMMIPLIAYTSYRYITCLNHYFRPMYWSLMFYMTFAFLIPGAYQASNDDYYMFWAGGYSFTAISTAIIFLYASIFTIDVGYRIGFGKTLNPNFPKPQKGHGAASPKLILIATISVLGIAAIFLGVAIYQLGISAFIGTRAAITAHFNDLGYTGGATRGFFSGLVRQFSILALIFTIYLFVATKQSVFKFPIVFTAIVICAVAINPLAMPRFITLGTALSGFILMVWYYQINSKILIIAPPLALYTVAPLLAGYNRGTEVSQLYFIPFSEYIRFADFDGMHMLILSIEYTLDNGLQMGRQVVSALLFFVPRSVWPEKALPTGTLLAQHEGFPFTNFSSSVFAEVWIDFGVLGLLLIWILGFALGRIDRLFNSGNATFYFILGTISLAGVLPMLVRGSLLGMIPQTIFLFIIPLFIKYIFRILFSNSSDTRHL